MFPCLGPEFISALQERSVKKAEESKRRRRKRNKVFHKLTVAIKKAWQNYVSCSGRPT